MPIPYPELPTEHDYQALLAMTLSENAPYTLTAPKTVDLRLYPVYFPGEHPPAGILPGEIPAKPPAEFYGENVNNLL